jgi:spermidine dehydrogenase
MTGEDRDLGMDRPITRRDFVSGVSVAIGGAVVGGRVAGQPSRVEAAAQEATATSYPPLRSGYRGAHPGSFEAAHAARGATTVPAARDTRETYDLVGGGGGLSGLAAAYYFRTRAGASARVLIIDNHDDFGGHAKRNEFVHNGRVLMATGGSAYMVAPSTWTSEARQILTDLGIEKGHPTHNLNRNLYLRWSGIDLVQTVFDEAHRAVRELEPRRYGYFERI